MKKDLSALDTAAALSVKMTAPSGASELGGKTVLHIPYDKTALLVPGKYSYDVQWVVPGSPTQVTTIALGIVVVVGDVTLSIA